MAITAYTDLSPKLIFDARADVYNDADGLIAKTTPIQDNVNVANWQSQIDASSDKAVTQSSDGSRPVYRAGTRPSILPALCFPSNSLAGGGAKGLSTTVMGAASGLLDNTATSYLAVVTPYYTMMDVSGGTDKAGFIAGAINSATPENCGFGLYRGNLAQFTGGTGAGTPTLINSGLWMPSSPCVVAVRADATNVTFRVGNRSASSAVAANITARQDRFYIGKSGSGHNAFLGRIHLIVAAASAWTDTQLQDAIDFAATDWGISLSPTVNFVAVGDSLVSGQSGGGSTTMANLDSWPTLLVESFMPAGSYTLSNCGIPGETAANVDSAFATEVAPFIRGGMRNIGLVLVGTNDISNGTAEATVVTSITSIIGKMRGAGCERVFLCTLPPAISAAYSAGDRTNLLDLNTLIRANYRAYGADGLIDAYAAFPTTRDYAETYSSTSTNDRTWDDTMMIDASGTKVHPTSIGHAAIARAAYRVVSPYISTIGGTTQYGTLQRRGRPIGGVR